MPGLTFGWSRADPSAVTNRHSGDPLGLRAWANRVTRELAPGLTNITTQVQGYALFCAGIRIAAQAASTKVVTPDEAFRRFEALWVHAQTRHLDAHPNVVRWPGTRAASRMADEASIDLSITLLTQPLASGIFGPYRRSAMRFLLANPPLGGGGVRPETAKLTQTGSALASLCLRELWTSPPGGNGALLKILRSGRVSAEQLSGVRPDDTPRHQESLLMTNSLVGSDQAMREGLTALRSRYDLDSNLSSVLEGNAVLTPAQNAALDSAKAIRPLIEKIELPYRSWLGGGAIPPPDAELWEDGSIWSEAAAAGETEVMTLKYFGKANPGWEGVHQWQKLLAARRGGDELERMFVPSGYGSGDPPAFGLLSAQSLFADGLLDTSQR